MYKEVIDNIPQKFKMDVLLLIGNAFVTKKRVSIPKAIYDELDKDQRKALRACLDCAAE